jgi:hypothetical protein
MTETTITTVRFPHISSPGALLRAPLPEALTATLPAKLRREHEKLAGRADEAAREIARRRAELDGATARDRTAASKAALEGAELPEPSEPKLRAQMEEAMRVRAALDSALRTSADRLLAAAAGNAAEVAAGLEQQLADRAADVRARLADTRDGVAELAELYAVAGWTRTLAEIGDDARISPFQAGRSAAFTATQGEIRTAEQALEHDLASTEERWRLARDQREHQRQLDAQWVGERARQAEQADAEVKGGP